MPRARDWGRRVARAMRPERLMSGCMVIWLVGLGIIGCLKGGWDVLSSSWSVWISNWRLGT